MIAAWTPSGGPEEYAVSFDRGRDRRLLVLPALFDEANKLRRLTVEVMRRLDAGGTDSFLPDLPGCNESGAPLQAQDLAGWTMQATQACQYFGASHVLAIRGGALLAPDGMPGWSYAPAKGQALLGTMLRARVVAAREAGREETRDALLAKGIAEGLTLAGHRLGARMIAQLQVAGPVPGLDPIAQGDIGGAGPWLRAEPGFDAAQADALAQRLLQGLAA